MKAKDLSFLFALVPLLILAGCGGGTGSTTPSSVTVPPGVSLVFVSVTPSNPSIADGATQQFAALGVLSDGTSQDITAAATWTSSSTTVATINASGLATGQNPGTTTITATLSGKSGTATLTVTSATLASVNVTPDTPSLPAGGNQQFTLTGSYSDGTSADVSGQATWTSSNPSVATVSTTGLVTAVAAGTTRSFRTEPRAERRRPSRRPPPP